MRRKSERNKAKGTPEKEVEKPTRKSTRRRAKRTHSSSPEPGNVEETVKSVSSKEIEKKSTLIKHQRKELEQPIEEHNEIVSSTETDLKTKLEENEEDNDGGSVWEVTRADASPGEIQKLKLCRQHTLSEASSDSSLSRKKSNKWQESGEGVAEEADSADEQLVSCTRTLSSAEQPNDPSSSCPGQDSNEEVSDSKEILPETTSANLSDDKPNIDQQGESNEANIPNENADSAPIKSSSTTISAPSSNGDHSSVAINIPKKETTVEDTSEKSTEAFSKEASVENVIRKDTSSDEDDDGKGKDREANSSSESNDEVRNKSKRSSGRMSCASRRKHRTKYRDSSNSDTPDSEDEPPIKREIEVDSYIQEEKANTEDSHEQKDNFESPKVKSNSLLNNMEIDVEHSEENKPKLDNVNEKKSEYSVSTAAHTVTHKPVKVNLKRSFSARIAAEKNDVKKEEVDSNANSETAVLNQENHDSAEQELKCAPRKRRWGTALSTDTAPSFSISTDSLKVLVPGARPLSINEVRLSKDDDEDRDRYRAGDKWYNLNDGLNDNKSGDEALMQKNGAAKKGDGKIDNHIAARRKISIVKETPHVKSPSPPATKPTNILLIKNLVRPFTLNQIKELLSRTGTIVENGFWMDRIKSKCFVEYANEDQAFETRQALHGISWPVSNPKRLHVEYATKDDMELTRELSKDQSIPRKTGPLVPSDTWQDWNRDERTNTKVMVVREWDLGKEDGQQHMKDKEREKKDHDKKIRQRSRSPTVEVHLPAPARKFKKKEDEPPPAKLLDDLFRKTKATPCIYWLPLTNEQIVVKEEMRRQHMAEHARRLEEMRRAERNNRDGRRRRSPRK
ncbi:apoptotic chromatin condensation inducer in the nucleus isoform X1 [Hylaeus anthracinus]|uniref:apoptotic chromatin condensation inducer in the nucleus isoform X1 n=1 Tax=Hylaeus anthracinus TaxID=313031 RepID=UPI0023BA1995|nr:apoptotic chromatin condensation inducer in the nucleus isoform X1 [Hylaeus anthracinus]